MVFRTASVALSSGHLNLNEVFMDAMSLTNVLAINVSVYMIVLINYT